VLQVAAGIVVRVCLLLAFGLGSDGNGGADSLALPQFTFSLEPILEVMAMFATPLQIKFVDAAGYGFWWNPRLGSPVTFGTHHWRDLVGFNQGLAGHTHSVRPQQVISGVRIPGWLAQNVVTPRTP
jgi:hypothetical protein